ncbi:MAG: hypothetical protein C7B43_20960 [Sulfobacillus benefaciens]|uniref:XRE family transcriptional regulator n=1 Tax=Sulfobacillus benefaciens TaxID=453960 RepID=A0A2T2WIL0_9FIRM|nr:MAG: hypothetical protein C7B43_20960 [Sulfobacillus benefaciens]
MTQKQWGDRVAVDPEAFGQALRRAREASGLSQENLAFAMTMIWRQREPDVKEIVSFNWVRVAERGQLKSVDANRIVFAAEALKIPLSQLLRPPATPKGKAALTATPANLVVAFRRYGLSDQDIDKLLPIIQQFAQGNPTVRDIIEHMDIPDRRDDTDGSKPENRY